MGEFIAPDPSIQTYDNKKFVRVESDIYTGPLNSLHTEIVEEHNLKSRIDALRITNPIELDAGRFTILIKGPGHQGTFLVRDISTSTSLPVPGYEAAARERTGEVIVPRIDPNIRLKTQLSV